METSPFDLSGKTALVTGASGGIGSAIARTLHAHGANLVISGTRKERLEELASELGERVSVQPANLSDSNDVNSLIERASQSYDGLDILVCNAGITQDSLAIKMTEDMFDQVINVNLKASFLLNRDAIKLMMKKKWGRVINISSIVASTGNAGQANYTASKGGLESMTRSLAQEVAPRNITVNAIAPGFIDTSMTSSLPDKVKEQILNKIPAKSMGSPDDIAYATLFLASNQARYITGHILDVNGGMDMS